MTALAYGKGAYRRENGGLPEFKLRNMFVERTPADATGIVLLSRQGLASYASVGGGPIRGIFAKSGVFNHDLFTISGATLYRGSTPIGGANGSGRASWAASPSEILVTLGNSLFLSDGAGSAIVGFPDGASVSAVVYLAGYFVAVRRDSRRFYWSTVLDGSAWDGLDYAAAESAPDNLIDAIVIGDGLWLLGGETVEFWAATGVAETPFARVEARLYRKGVIARGCAVELDNSLFWIGHDRIVYRGGETPERVSDHGIEERIAASAEWSAFGYIHEGHSFFCITLDSGTFALDAATGQWCEFATFGAARWRVHCATDCKDGLVFGDETSADLWRFGTNYHDGSVMERLFTSAFTLSGGTAQVHSLRVDCNVGRTPVLTGQGTDPVMEMRSSRDAGQTWGAWRPAPMGVQGEYRQQTKLLRWGMFDAPGAMFEHRVTDPVPLRISGVYVNEANGGRPR